MQTKYPLAPWCLSLLLCACLSACGGGGGDDSTAASSGDTPAGDTPAATPAADPVAAAIDTFGIDEALEFNPLGGLIYKVYPIALFKDGRALLATAALISPDGLEAHRAKSPRDWTQWRRSGTAVEILKTDGSWKALKDPQSLRVLPADFRLNAPYETITAASSLFPNLSVATSTKYTFTQSGEVARDLYAIGNTPNLSFVSLPPDKRGTYTVRDGFRLSITLADGKKEEHVIVADPAKPKYIFINGTLYWIPD